MLAYWNHRAPERIKDGQTHLRGVELTMDGMKERYARVAEFYFRKLLPDVVLTMAPYEYTPPPNDHWACAHGVMEAATRCDIVHVYYSHSGIVYQHVHHGSAYLGRRVELKPSIWEAKIKALGQYMRWEPENGWYATALHSVPKTFHALLSGCGRHEYINDHPDW
jgi:LmbE family N-acetylglucosaminyl deacetylase